MVSFKGFIFGPITSLLHGKIRGRVEINAKRKVSWVALLRGLYRNGYSAVASKRKLS